ncbi:MAG: hypothetical protein NTW49_09665 [Bacteroidia bacterium]|nr:hypothetical protein [Bacteroidia bacterium]
MIGKIFSNIGFEIQSFETTTADNTDRGEKLSVIRTKSDAYQCAHIFVEKFGKDILLSISKTLKAFCVNRVETVYLYLPLTCPETSYLCSEFESMGFFFGGLRPGKEGTIWLLLQYLNNQKYDYDKLRFCSDFGQELMQYIKNHDPNLDGTEPN